jgi:PIN domain nuclease of toxin-antitoxin system
VGGHDAIETVSNARLICQSAKETLVVSVVSLWEIIIKARRGSLPISAPAALLPAWIGELGDRVLAVQAGHVYGVDRLPAIHRDPFDRLLVQAIIEDMPLVVSDETVHRYPARCVW